MNEPNALTPLQQAAIARKVLEAEVVSRAWSDETFRAKLEAHPAATLAEAGLPVPDGLNVAVVSEPPGTITLTIPAAPDTRASDEELAAVAGGGLLDEGKCRLIERTKRDSTTQFLGGVALVMGSYLGLSWGWG
jgi:hypothetical protein